MNEPGAPGPDREPVGSLRPISPRALGIGAACGLVVGWLIHRVAGEGLRVSWAQPSALFLVAVILAFLAWHTWRTVHVRGHRLEPQHSVNRLVLARACAVAGAIVGGAYVGLAIGWLGDASLVADRWITRSLAAAAASVAILLASLALESACRTPDQHSHP